MSLSTTLLPEFDQETANLRRTLERVPDEKLDWKPHPKSMSLGGLATHLANMLTWVNHTLETSELDIAPGGKTLLSLPRTACLRSFVLNHMIHHRGQLTVYLRLLDVPVPALYGPSADEGRLG